jgi:hypothetical protein
MFALLLLLTVGAVSVPAQSAKGTLTVTAQVVASTALVVGADGQTRIIEANGSNGLTITTVGTPIKASVTGAGTPAAITPQPQPAAQASGTRSK